MKSYRVVAAFAFVAFAYPTLSRAQVAVVKAKAALRVTPSTIEPPELTLQAGDTVTIVDPTPEHGYLQVTTKNGKEGWIFHTSIRIVASPSSSNPVIDPEAAAASGTTPKCDTTLWNHVYNPHRLIVKQACIAVTGTFVDASGGKKPDGVRHEADGDTHGWLKVDPPFENLLNAGNMSAEGGNLVFEIVCEFPVNQPDAKAACASFKSPIKIPPVGSHVRIVGSYVRDTNHAQWMEIHPVSSIEVIRP